METIPIPIQKELKKICWKCLGDADEYSLSEGWAAIDGCERGVITAESVKCIPCNRVWNKSTRISYD